VAVESYLAQGYLPEALRNYLATLGWGAPDGVEIRPIEEIVELFDIANVSSAPAMFDRKKLDHFNGEYLRALTVDEFVERAQPWLRGAAAPWPDDAFDPDVFVRMAPLVQERVHRLAEVPDMVDFLFCADDQMVAVRPPGGGENPPSTPDGPPAPAPRTRYDESAWQKVMESDRELAVQMLDVALERFATLEPWTASTINDAVIGYADEHELSRKKAQAPIRVAITGRSVGPPLWESLEVLGRDRALGRLQAARQRLG
jgi:glutamyl-tRNA synthetase